MSYRLVPGASLPSSHTLHPERTPFDSPPHRHVYEALIHQLEAVQEAIRAKLAEADAVETGPWSRQAQRQHNSIGIWLNEMDGELGDFMRRVNVAGPPCVVATQAARLADMRTKLDTLVRDGVRVQVPFLQLETEKRPLQQH